MFNFKRSLIALVGVLVLVVALTAMMPLVSRGQGGNPLTRDTRRSFYVTKTFHNGSEVLTACAEGYHMASLWEILDPSNLRYDTVLGFTRDDSGSGPPSGRDGRGWIRTGYSEQAGSSSGAGTGNCSAWTSANFVDDGSMVSLNNVWSDALAFNPWVFAASSCNANRRVWCMQD